MQLDIAKQNLAQAEQDMEVANLDLIKAQNDQLTIGQKITNALIGPISLITSL